MKKYDAIIIGFGKGGKTLAAGLAERNFTVAMIERSDKMYGGTCINIGCIPTKTLIHSAKLADTSASWEQKRAYYRPVCCTERGSYFFPASEELPQSVRQS